MDSLKQPLSNLQMELLKLYSANIPEEQLTEIKKMISAYLMERARDKADVLWDKKNLGNELNKMND